MATVGRFVTDPEGGAYCWITLDSGEKMLVSHRTPRITGEWSTSGGLGTGWLTIEVSKFFGFGSDRIFACGLDSPEGSLLLARLIRDARQRSVESTLLEALVRYVIACESAVEVKTRCAALIEER